MSIIIPAVVSFLMLIADQITKMAVVSYFGDSGKTVPVIKGVLSFCFVENNGAGFSILAGNTLFLLVFTAIAMALVVYMIVTKKFKSPLTDWGFCLILSGGLGNFLDRVFRDGLVVDFIKTDFIDFPIFNIADICVTMGAGFLILYFLLDTLKDFKSKKGRSEDGQA